MADAVVAVIRINNGRRIYEDYENLFIREVVLERQKEEENRRGLWWDEVRWEWREGGREGLCTV